MDDVYQQALGLLVNKLERSLEDASQELSTLSQAKLNHIKQCCNLVWKLAATELQEKLGGLFAPLLKRYLQAISANNSPARTIEMLEAILLSCGNTITKATVKRVQHQKNTGRNTLVKIQCQQELAALNNTAIITDPTTLASTNPSTNKPTTGV